MSRCTWDTARAIKSFVYRAFTFYGHTFQSGSTRFNKSHSAVPQPFSIKSKSLGSFGFARHYSRNHYCFLFLRLLRCFSSAGCHPLPKAKDILVLANIGFPIRRSPAHSYFDSSPRLIAANHVLHRLAVPRYPLCALIT